MTEPPKPRKAKRGREIFEPRYAPPAERESSPPLELDAVNERTAERIRTRHRTASPWTEREDADE